MRSQQDSAGAPSFGQRLWERTWWIFGFLFLAVNVWAWNRFGGFAVARCFAALFAVLGASILLYGWRRRRYAMESVYWLPVQARVVSSEVVVKEDRSEDIHGYIDVRVSYYPEIEYEYEVEGKKYRSGNLFLVNVNVPREEAEAWVAKYPPGTVVTARRHPEKPGLAVIQPGIKGYEFRYWLLIIMGGVFLAAGSVGWILLAGR